MTTNPAELVKLAEQLTAIASWTSNANKRETLIASAAALRLAAQKDVREADLERIIYDEVEADIETEADADTPFGEGYAVGFNDARFRIKEAMMKLLGIHEQRSIND